jgi:hypothetical protein
LKGNKRKNKKDKRRKEESNKTEKRKEINNGKRTWDMELRKDLS